jgi:DNA-directed RNA polymerase specialized sigma24 family protein
MDSYPSHNFPLTSRSMIRAVQHRSGEDRLEAMNRSIAAYWKPVFYFIRTRGYPLHRAEDLTQEFFLQFFFEQDWVRRADQHRGRFRSFLLTVLTRFLADQAVDRAPRQKAFDQRQVPISALLGDSERTFEPPQNRTPEQIFMHQWAKSAIASVQRNLESWCTVRGRPDWYRMFCAMYFPEPGRAPLTQQAVADRLHLSRDQVRYGLEAANRQFVEFLRAEVGAQIGPGDDLDAEIRELRTLLSG